MDLLEVFRDSDDVVEYSTGSVIFEEGSKAEFMYVILDGEIRLSLHGQTIATTGEGL
jgi:CRP-like cAMP-binding protein